MRCLNCCSINTGGNHEWDCPLNKNNSLPIPRKEREIDELKNLHICRWELEKLAGYIRIGVEGVYIICRGCGVVKLVDVNKPTPTSSQGENEK